jgi:hypothetical protein
MCMLIRITLLLIGGSHLVTFTLAFFAPGWFFTNIAHFPPFNAHFLADIGAFNAPLGAGLLVAASNPVRHRLPIGLAALGNLLHALSHLRDWDLHMPPYMEAAAGLSQQILILLPGLLLLLIALSGEHHARAVAVPARPK